MVLQTAAAYRTLSKPMLAATLSAANVLFTTLLIFALSQLRTCPRAKGCPGAWDASMIIRPLWLFNSTSPAKLASCTAVNLNA
eukprot:6474409-Amphidinium_carterae.1